METAVEVSSKKASLGSSQSLLPNVRKHVTLNEEQVRSAVEALHQFLSSKNESSKTSLFGDENDIYLTVVYNKVPEKARAKPILIPLPHQLWQSNPEICVFVKDPQAKAKEELKAKNVNVEKVISITKLKTNYGRFEDKRKLCYAYDIFLADNNIIPLLPKLLGKKFFLRKKQPFAIEMDNVEQEIEKVKNGTAFFLSLGPSSAIRIGNTAMKSEDVVANIIAGMQSVAQYVPKKWDNIKAIYVKTADSPALPIYNTLPEASRILDPLSTASVHKSEQIVVEEEEEEKVAVKKPKTAQQTPKQPEKQPEKPQVQAQQPEKLKQTLKHNQPQPKDQQQPSKKQAVEKQSEKQTPKPQAQTQQTPKQPEKPAIVAEKPATKVSKPGKQEVTVPTPTPTPAPARARASLGTTPKKSILDKLEKKRKTTMGRSSLA